MVRAKFGISRKENWGNSGIVRMEPGRLSARKWNSWEHKSVKCRFYRELPKLDVAGSTPVARSNFPRVLKTNGRRRRLSKQPVEQGQRRTDANTLGTHVVFGAVADTCHASVWGKRAFKYRTPRSTLVSPHLHSTIIRGFRPSTTTKSASRPSVSRK
jgi:hypothetical protein